MTIMDGVKLGIGVALGRTAVRLVSDKVIKCIAEDEWNSDLFKEAKERILKDKKLCERLNIETVTEEKEEPVMRSIGFKKD